MKKCIKNNIYGTNNVGEGNVRKNRMGNLLSIAGDDAEDIKKFIDFFYRKIRKAMIRKRNA